MKGHEVQREGLSSVMRVTAHDSSLCGGSLLGCAAAGRFAPAGARRGTEPVWQLSDRPRHPFGPIV